MNTHVSPQWAADLPTSSEQVALRTLRAIASRHAQTGLVTPEEGEDLQGIGSAAELEDALVRFEFRWLWELLRGSDTPCQGELS